MQRIDKHALLGLLATAMIGGCSQGPTEETHIVSWYMQPDHKAERLAKIKWCEDSADRAATTPNCLNAAEAQQKVQLQPNAPSTADGFKFK